MNDASNSSLRLVPVNPYICLLVSNVFLVLSMFSLFSPLSETARETAGVTSIREGCVGGGLQDGRHFTPRACAAHSAWSL